MTINVAEELAAANQRLPVAVDRTMPLDITLRTIALAVAQRHIGDTTVHEGGLYTALKMDNKVLNPVSVEHVVRAALVFERYLWGEWLKGIAEQAIPAVSTEAADAIEKMMEERLGGTGGEGDDPARPTSGEAPAA